MRSHKDLIVWQKSMELVVSIYKTTRDFPKEEQLGITAQMRRAAISIPSNIAEGYGRVYDKETIKFLSNALGSASELETQLILSKDLDFISLKEGRQLLEQTEEIIKMLSALIKTVNC